MSRARISAPIVWVQNNVTVNQTRVTTLCMAVGPGRGRGGCLLKWGFTRTFPRNQDATLKIGMAIPRRILFLEESRSRGMANLHSSGIEEDEIYSSGSSGNFEE